MTCAFIRVAKKIPRGFQKMLDLCTSRNLNSIDISIVHRLYCDMLLYTQENQRGCTSHKAYQISGSATKHVVPYVQTATRRDMLRDKRRFLWRLLLHTLSTCYESRFKHDSCNRVQITCVITLNKKKAHSEDSVFYCQRCVWGSCVQVVVFCLWGCYIMITTSGKVASQYPDQRWTEV